MVASRFDDTAGFGEVLAGGCGVGFGEGEAGVAEVGVGLVEAEAAAGGEGESFVEIVARGAACSVDPTDGWDFWSVVDRPLAELRRDYGIAPLSRAVVSTAHVD